MLVAVLKWCIKLVRCLFFFSSRRRHTRCSRDWSSDVCSSDLYLSRAPRSSPQGLNLKRFLDFPPIRFDLVSFLPARSEEHTSELQSRLHLVCRLLLEKKNASESRIKEILTESEISSGPRRTVH